ncbi:hypothetical protein C461_11008 [Halorubrum aidingense JCM 13560]|uniref:DUF447 family protein n=1 Tax=Halorubrum aidingense JCM 13560 TaxID=1230454 RepID=M0PCM2_9EURY|nr:DUF447 domain-containing protein [Halorubrum aidingense]EMA66565.1 hypothetical protein C461_11008 [Halorubrum aidingense JCM 13560]
MTDDASHIRDANGADGSDHRGVVPDGWPVPLRGVTESIVTTLGPNDRWNVAALGLHAPDVTTGTDEGDESDAPNDPTAHAPADLVTARTYGRTRTWRNFTERGHGVVQFTTDPRTFVDAALAVREIDDPVLPDADAWVEVTVEEIATEADGDTTIRTWALTPVESEVRRRTVPTINRGFGAVVDATVAASRLDVPGFDTTVLLDRLRYFDDVVGRCGGPAEREAFARIDEETGWRSLTAGETGDES